jgi:hypothetical protein
MSHNTLRFVTLAGNVDLDIDEKFDMSKAMTDLRAAGYMMHPGFYVPINSILAVFTFDKEAQPGTPDNVNLSSEKGKLN